MNGIFVAVISILVSLQVAGAPTENKLQSPFRAESSAYIVRGKDAWTYVTENHTFRFAEVLGDDGNYEAALLLEETYHNERTDGIEGVRGNATVKAWTLDHSGRRDFRWTFKEHGNEGVALDRFFRVTAWGCCDIPVFYSYYSILTGEKLYVSNFELLEVREGGVGPLATRYVAFGYSGSNKLSQPPKLQYGTDKKVSQSFSIVSSREYYDAPELSVSVGEKLEKSLDLTNSPKSFSIVLRYSDGIELQIPVEGDVVRPEKARLPLGYSIQRESLNKDRSPR